MEKVQVNSYHVDLMCDGGRIGINTSNRPIQIQIQENEYDDDAEGDNVFINLSEHEVETLIVELQKALHQLKKERDEK